MRIARTAVICALLLAAAGAGCEGNRGHVQPHAMVIRQGAEILVHARGNAVDGVLAVTTGAETPLLSVRFLDRSGTELSPGSRFYLELQAADPGLFEWRPTEPGAFDGRLTGAAPGTTTVLVRWMHGRPGTGHKDRDWPVTLVSSP